MKNKRLLVKKNTMSIDPFLWAMLKILMLFILMIGTITMVSVCWGKGTEKAKFPFVSNKKEINTKNRKEIKEKLDSLPLIFRQNMGQWDDLTPLGKEKILYSGASLNGINVYFMNTYLRFSMPRETEVYDSLQKVETERFEFLNWNVRFVGANSKSKLVAEGKQDSHTNYFLGKDPSKWKTNVPDYSLLVYNNLYNNIDLKYYGSGSALKYDYVLKPGADMKNIQMACEGIKKLNINSNGELEITTEWGKMIERTPYSYQIVNGKKKEVDVRYQLLNDSTYGFKAYAVYDPTKELIIDPITLQWATYVSGNAGESYLLDIALDPAGNVYGTGWASSSAFPTNPGVYQRAIGGGIDGFVFKLNANATSLLYCTYLGGSGMDYCQAIAVNNTGEAFITGIAASGFPVTSGCYQNTSVSGSDAFVARLNSTGTALIYSTYVGGSTGKSESWGIDINNNNEAYICGNTQANDFPVVGGIPGLSGAGAFITKLNATGSSLLYSTCLGGGGAGTSVNVQGYLYKTGTTAARLVLDKNTEEAYVTGWTTSPAFPVTPGCFQSTPLGRFSAFVTKLNSLGNALIYSTYLGGGDVDMAKDIAIESSGCAYITGFTYSLSKFPATTKLTDPSGYRTATFVTKLNPTGSGLLYSLIVGGGSNAGFGGDSYGESIAVNAGGEAFVTGITSWSSFPTMCPFQNYDPRGGGNFFVFRVNSSGTSLLSSTFIGGTDECPGEIPEFTGVNICLDAAGAIVVGGVTNDDKFPMSAATFQKTKPGGVNALDECVVFKLTDPCNRVILPDQLLAFTGDYNNKEIALRWKTASENNNDFFSIERSTDGKSFYEIGKIKGAGNSNITLTYSFVDNTALPGTLYYRLKQMNYNGNSTYSNTIAIKVSGGDIHFSAYPNPLNDNHSLQVEFYLQQEDQLTLVLRNPQGQEVYNKSKKYSTGITQINIPTEGLPKGIYILQMQCDDKISTQKIMVE